MTAVHAEPGARAGAFAPAECAVLDAGARPIAATEFGRAIAAIVAGAVPACARDRNAICYRVDLAESAGAAVAAIVKRPRMGPQRTNADATFAWEAAMLAALPAAGIGCAPALLARVVAGGEHFLFMTEMPGRHPDPADAPFDGPQLRSILDHLFEMDRRGLMHYDLKPGNILVEGDRAGFIDFEFARFQDSDQTWTAANAARCADFNVSGNPHFPAHSNVANFEFRALDRYLADIDVAAAGSAAALHGEWLAGKAVCHRRMALHLDAVPDPDIDRMAHAAGMSALAGRAKLRAAAAHERLLAGLYEQPHDAVLRIERLLMGFRCAVFERNAAAVRRLGAAATAMLDPAAAHAGALPDAYRQGCMRILDLVARSVHPGATDRLREATAAG